MRRSASNPILTRDDVPDVAPHVVDASSVFNPGAALIDGQTRLLLRVQTRGRRTHFMWATSDDGERFSVEPRLVEIRGLADVRARVHHAYDARLTWLDGELRCVFAVDTDIGCRLATARVVDGDLELIAFDASGDLRNGVLFPERIGGRFARLERPNEVVAEGAAPTGDAIALSYSDDLVSWERAGTVMSGRRHYWDELIGAGPPPARVDDGWLVLYHGVATHGPLGSLYQAGVALLDADDPTRVLARTRDNVLEPRETYEMVGQVPNVVFPSGWIVDGPTPDSAVRIYYGAADTCVALATTTVGELLEAARTR